MSEPKVCCNCLHCARWQKKNGIECHCDLDDRYLGYLQVMDEENDCKNWEKETKWDLQREHDAKVRADALEEFREKINKYLAESTDFADFVVTDNDIDIVIEEMKGGAK